MNKKEYKELLHYAGEAIFEYREKHTIHPNIIIIPLWAYYELQILFENAETKSLYGTPVIGSPAISKLSEIIVY